MISNLLVYVVTWLILHIDTAGPETKIGPADGPKFQRVVLIGLTIGTIATFIFHCFVKEENGYAQGNVRGGQLRSSASEIFSNIQIYQVCYFEVLKNRFSTFVSGCCCLHVNTSLC